MANPKVAVVTGGNKGIGFAIVKELCKKFDGVVYLTARDEKNGKNAIAELEKQGLKPKYHQLDIDNLESIHTFRDFLKSTHGGLDLLVNNAAIAYKNAAVEPFGEQAENTMRVNFTGTLNVCHALFPLLRPYARVVNLSSSVGQLSIVKGSELREKLKADTLTEEQLAALIEQFVECAKAGTHLEKGWAGSAYGMSKVGVTALTRIQQRHFDKDSRHGIIVTAVHPGYVDTDMTSHKGPLTPEQGAEAPVHCALLPHDADEYKGAYVWNDKKITEWK